MKGDASRRQPRLLPRLVEVEEAYAVVAPYLRLYAGHTVAALRCTCLSALIVAGAHPD